jgi:hypothetical protein
MRGPEIVVPIGFSPIDPSSLVPSMGPWTRRFARVRMMTMAGLMSWACSQISPKCWAVLAAAPWRETSSGLRWSALPSKQCGPTSMAKGPVWSLNTEKSGAHPLSGVECYSVHRGEKQAHSVHTAQLSLAKVQGGELDMGECHVPTPRPAHEHAIGLPKVGVATVIEQPGNRLEPEILLS